MPRHNAFYSLSVEDIIPADDVQSARGARGVRKPKYLGGLDEFGGASRARTDGLVVANDALSQLSYSPTRDGLLLC
jgi:hypothetical protein